MTVVDGGAIRRVLIVDDDLQLLQSYRVATELSCGWVVMTASAAAVAHDVARAHRPDACIVDLHLGGESGIDLIQTLRGEDPEVFLVLISGCGDLEDGAAAIGAGANRVFAKPVTPPEILESFWAWAREPRREAMSLEAATRNHMQCVLEACAGNKSEAARVLGIDRGTLQRWLDRPPRRR